MAVCNLFNDLTNPSGNFLMFSQYVESITKNIASGDTEYKVIPSKFIALNIDYTRLNMDKLIGNSTLLNDPIKSLNSLVPKYFQNYFENGCAYGRGLEIDDFTWNWSESPHVKEPKVAPGMKGYFDLKIDPTGTDVSIKYTLTIDDSKIAEMLGISADEAKDRINLKMTGIVENGVEIELPRDEDGNIVITKIKTLEQIKSENESDRVDNLEVEVTWENNEDNNDIDSQIGSVANSTIKLPVKVDVIQWTGE